MPILYDKGTRVRVLESSGDKCAGGLGVVVDISDTALFQYTVKVDGERGFRNYRIGEIEKVEKKVASPRLDDRVTVVLEGSPYTGKSGVVVEVYDFKEKPYRVEFIGDGWLKSYGYFDAEDLELLKVEDLVVAETPGEFQMGDFVEVDSRATTFFGMRGVVEQVRQFANERYLVQFFEVDAGRESYCWFSHDELALLVKPESVSVEDRPALQVKGPARRIPEVGDLVKVTELSGEVINPGGTGTVITVDLASPYPYVVNFWETAFPVRYSADELEVVESHTQSKDSEESVGVPVVEEPGVALIGKTVQIKPGVMFAGEFGTVAGVHDSGNNTYHVDFGTGERIKHYYPLECLEILPSVGDRVKINEGHIRAGDIGRVTDVELDSGSPWRVVFDNTESVAYRYFVEDLEVVPEDVPGGGMDWSDSVAVPIVVPEAPVKALEDEFVRIRLEDGQVVVESLGTPFDEVRIASGLLHGLIRQWHEREEGANRRTAMDMLDLGGLFGELPEEDQAVVDSVVAMMKRRDWI